MNTLRLIFNTAGIGFLIGFILGLLFLYYNEVVAVATEVAAPSLMFITILSG